MIKKILTGAILLGLLLAGSLMAEEKWTLNIYVDVYGYADQVDIGYLDIDHNIVQWSVQTYYNVSSGTTIHCQINVWPDDPCPIWVFAEGWGPQGDDYDECDATLHYPMDLELYLGVVPEDPTIPQEE
ncbi:MAG: hypothetical protein KAW92_04340 [Candidatus Cloacimonetes bacterium]|nr:hypothetical protein [Candidatus Cloacimonadota bacterium]